MKRRAFVAGALLAPLCYGLFQARPGGKENASPPGPRAHYFPNFELLTHENRKVRFYDDLIRGKLVTFNFMYTACSDGFYPRMMANLVQVQRALGSRVGRDLFMYSITLTPEQDTPEVLKAYAEQMGVKPGWSFLTGKPGEIELIRRKLGFVDPDATVDQDKDSHSGLVLFGNEALDRWAACSALARPAHIAEQILWLDPRTKSRNSDGRTRIITA